MTDTVKRWLRPSDPIRLVSSSPVPIKAVTSIVSTATAILREELQSLAPGGVSPPLTSSLANAFSIAGQPNAGVQPLVESLAQLLRTPPDQLMQVITETFASQGDGNGSSQSVRVLCASQSVVAGEVARLVLNLENDDDQPDECAVHVTDLVGPSGGRIPASHVRVLPSPARIPPHGSTDIRIEVRIPSGTLAGCYTGLLQSDDGDAVRALIQVFVGP